MQSKTVFISQQKTIRWQWLWSFGILLILSFVTISDLQASPSGIDNSRSIVQASISEGSVSPAILIQRGNTLLDKQQFKQAVENFNKAIRMDRSQDAAFLGRGLAYGGLGKYENSIADFNVYILRNPKHSMAHVYRGARYLSMGAVEYAEENLLKAISLNKNNAQAYDDLGVLYAQVGDYKKAVKFFAKSVTIDNYNGMAYHNLAIALYLIDNNKVALQAIDRAIHLMPESRDSYILKAQILESIGQQEQASKLRAYAEFLNDPHWSESVSLQ